MRVSGLVRSLGVSRRQVLQVVGRSLARQQKGLRWYHVVLSLYIGLLWRSTKRTSEIHGGRYWRKLHERGNIWRTFVAAHVSLGRYIITKVSLGMLILRSLTAGATIVPQLAASFMEKQSAALQESLQTRVEGFLDQQMDLVGEKFKGLVKDPYMPLRIQSTIDDFVDVLLPDIKLALFTKTNEYIRSYRAKRTPRRRRPSEAAFARRRSGRRLLQDAKDDDAEDSAELEIDQVLDSLMEDVDDDEEEDFASDFDDDDDDDEEDDDDRDENHIEADEDDDDDDEDEDDVEEDEDTDSETLSEVDSSSDAPRSEGFSLSAKTMRNSSPTVMTRRLIARRAGQARRLCWRWRRRWMRRSKRRQRNSMCFARPKRTTIRRTARGVRAWVLYTLAPFDRSFWRMLRSPWYIVLQFVGLIPGVGMLWWFFVFILHDKRDEFQLSQFIVGFQSAKFFSQGCLNLIRGAFAYFWCANREVPTCATEGPMIKEYSDAIFFAVQIVIVWLTFFILPYSEPCRAVNDPRDAHLLDEARTDRNQAALRAKVRLGRGGRLRNLFWWDTFAVCTVLALGALAYFGLELRGWQLRATLYWLSTIYGLTAMPFILFKLPIMGNLLTPTKATGYTRKGYTVLRVIPPPPQPLVEYHERVKARSEAIAQATGVRGASRFDEIGNADDVDDEAIAAPPMPHTSEHGHRHSLLSHSSSSSSLSATSASLRRRWQESQEQRQRQQEEQRQQEVERHKQDQKYQDEEGSAVAGHTQRSLGKSRLLPTLVEAGNQVDHALSKLASPISSSSASTLLTRSLSPGLSNEDGSHEDQAASSWQCEQDELERESRRHGRFFLPDKYEQRYGDYHPEGPEEDDGMNSPTSPSDFAPVGIHDVTAEVAARTTMNQANAQLLFNLRRLRSSSSLFEDGRSA